MPLPKPEQAAKPGAMTMLVGDDAEKTELKLGKMGWQSHYPHSDKKTNDNFELSLPAKLEFSAANPALVLDLAASADAAAVKAAAQVFGEVRCGGSCPPPVALLGGARASAAPPRGRARHVAPAPCGAERYAVSAPLRASLTPGTARVPVSSVTDASLRPLRR